MVWRSFRNARGARALWLALVFVGCGDGTPAAQLGSAWFADSALVGGSSNAFACATCHTVDRSTAAAPGLLPGYDLFDAVHRPSWWGGAELTLLASINDCVVD